MQAKSPNKKPLQVNPIKLSQSMGATLAFLGIKWAMPLIHGAQGCASLALPTDLGLCFISSIAGEFISRPLNECKNGLPRHFQGSQ